MTHLQTIHLFEELLHALDSHNFRSCSGSKGFDNWYQDWKRRRAIELAALGGDVADEGGSGVDSGSPSEVPGSESEDGAVLGIGGEEAEASVRGEAEGSAQ